jgi:hypothetical protein
MDARESFKFGFIARCIDAGLTTPAQIAGAAKQAAAAVEKQALFGLDHIPYAGNALDTVGTLGATALLAGPPLVGAALGGLASKATDVGDYDVDEAKSDEVIDEYHRQADRLRREGMLRRHTDSGIGRAPSGPLL